jgi:hypothetical protein
MNSRNEARWDAGKRVKTFNTEEATQLATIPGYADEQAEFNELMERLDKAAALQQQDTTGITVSKDALRVTMAKTMVKYAKRGVVKANRAGNTGLSQGIDHPEKYYTIGSADTAISRATAVRDVIKNNLATLNNITVEEVKEMTDAITAFANKKDTPTTTNQTKKILGTNQIIKLLDKLDIVIDHMNYLIDSYFEGTTLAEKFDAACKLILLGTRNNTVILNIDDADTGNPIDAAIVTIGKKTAEADEEGIALFESIRTGKQTFTVTATGYTTQTISLKVIRSTTTEGVVKLKKG